MEQVSVNTIRMGSAGGPGHFADLLPGQPSVAIVVTERYLGGDDDDAARRDPGESSPPTTFTALLSAEDTPRPPTPNPSSSPSPSPSARARAEARRREDFLLAHRARGTAGAPCPRYQRLRAFRDGVPEALRALLAPGFPGAAGAGRGGVSASQDRFCDEHCADLHPPAPSTFPGDRLWTFAAAGAASRAARPGGDDAPPLAPERPPPPPSLARALARLARLGDEVARARGRGLRDVWVAVVAAEPMGLVPVAPRGRWAAYDMQALAGACAAEARAWAPSGRVVFGWRDVGEERRLCVQRGDFWVEKPGDAVTV